MQFQENWDNHAVTGKFCLRINRLLNRSQIGPICSLPSRLQLPSRSAWLESSLWLPPDCTKITVYTQQHFWANNHSTETGFFPKSCAASFPSLRLPLPDVHTSSMRACCTIGKRRLRTSRRSHATSCDSRMCFNVCLWPSNRSGSYSLSHTQY